MTGAKTTLRNVLLIAAGALAAAWFVAPTPADAAYAIAFNPQSGRAGASNFSWDLGKTQRDALSKCGSGCRIVSSGKKTCAAVVESISTGTSAWAVATASSTSTAANAAWHGCRRKGGVTCKTAAAICD